jgi:hypothetical protein
MKIGTCKDIQIELCRYCISPTDNQVCYLETYNDIINNFTTFKRVCNYFYILSDNKLLHRGRVYNFTPYLPYFMRALEINRPNWFSRLQKLIILK